MPNLKFTTHSLYDWLVEYVTTHSDDKCWLWPYTKTRGYGHIKINGHLVYVHRVAFQIRYGRFPEPFGLHKCDVRNCFNPRHIFEGDNQANVADMVKKNRQRGPFGARNSHAVFDDDTVRKIRREHVTVQNNQTLANHYGVTRATIREIVTRQAWKNVV